MYFRDSNLCNYTVSGNAASAVDDFKSLSSKFLQFVEAELFG